MSIELKDIGIRESGVKTFRFQKQATLKKDCLQNSNVQVVDIPNIESIDDGAFENCLSLAALSIGGIEQVGNILGNNHMQLSNLQNVYLHDGIKDIGTSLSGLSSLENIRFPTSLIVVQPSAFCECDRLRTIEFNHEIKLMQNSFAGMNGLEMLKMPIDDIDATDGNLGLSANDNLKQIICFNSNPSYEIAIQADTFRNCKALQIEFSGNGTNITSIAPSSFAGSKIRTINLQNASLTSIPSYAFANCTNLTSVQFSDENILRLEENCFQNTGLQRIPLYSNLKYIDNVGKSFPVFTGSFPNAITHIGATTFANAFFADDADINLSSLAEVGKMAFKGSDIQMVNFEDNTSLNDIPEECFAECNGLQSVANANSSIKNVGQKAFYNCNTLSSFDFNDITSFGASSFYDVQIANIDLENAIKVGDRAFENNIALTSLTCSKDMLNSENLGTQVFYKCNNIQQIHAENLTDIDLHRQLGSKDCVLSIDYSQYVESVRHIYENLCYLFGIDYQSSNFTFHLKNGVVINKDVHIDDYECLEYSDQSKTILTACNTDKKGYATFLASKILPSSTKEIETGTFSEQSQKDIDYIDLQNVDTLADNVFENFILTSYTGNHLTSIGNQCFKGCSCLINATVPNSLVQLGASAYYNCNHLTSFAFENGSKLATISQYTFSGCERLTSLNLPLSVSKFEENAFNGSSILRFDIQNQNALGIGSGSEVANSCKAKDKAMFYTSRNNFQYPTFIVNENKIKRIMNSAFNVDGDMALTYVDPNVLDITQTSILENDFTNIKTIRRYAFENATQLTSIALPTQLYSTLMADRNNGFFENANAVHMNQNYEAISGKTIGDIWQKMFGDATDESNKRVYFNDCYILKVGEGNVYQKIDRNDPLVATVLPSGENVVYEVNDELVQDGEVVAGSEHDSISAKAFFRSDAIRKLNLNEISSIQDFAFYGNATLSTLIANDNLKSVGASAFVDSGLVAFSIPSSVNGAKVNGFGLNQSPFLKKVEFQRGITDILPSAFVDSGAQLTSYTFTDTISSIGAYAFAETLDQFPRIENLENFNALDKISVIEPYAFYNSISTMPDKRLMLPKNVLSIMDSAFAYNRYTYTQDITEFWLDRINVRNAEYIGPSAFIYNHLKSLKFNSNNILSIEDYAFAYPKYKFDIDVPGSIEHVGQRAFYKNKILNPEALDKNIAKFGKNNVRDLLSVFNVRLDSNYCAENIAGFTDYTCISATGTNVNYLSDFAIVLDNKMNFCPDNVQIDLLNGELVAANKSAITAFVPSYVRKIGTSAFMDSASLTALSANEGLEFGVSAFANCKKLQYFNDPETIYFIDNAPDYVFYDCQKLKNVMMLSTLESIGQRAFQNCDAISCFQNLSGDLKKDFKYWKLSAINDYAFYDCDSLETFSIPRTISKLGSHTFYSCDKLTSLNFDIDSHEFANRFNDRFSQISDIIYEKFNDIRDDHGCYINFTDITYTNDGKLKNDNEFVEIGVESDGSHSVLALKYDDYQRATQVNLNLSSVTSIDPFVFCNIEKLERVSFIVGESTNENINYIGDYAFAKCYNLAYVNNSYLPVSYIGDYAFADCRFLLEMKLDADKIVHIGQGAFFNTSLNKLVFQNCNSASLSKIRNAAGYDELTNRNPMELPEFCEITLVDRYGNVIGKYDYMFNNMLHASVDINRNQLVFVDKARNYIKPLLLVKPKDNKHQTAIVANTFHASIIGRWK